MDYLPEIRELRSASGLTIDEVVNGVGGGAITVLPVPHDCRDGMTVAFWRRPEAYLDPEVRLGGSALRELDSTAFGMGTGPARSRSAKRSLDTPVRPSSGPRRVRLRPAPRRLSGSVGR
jgi:hypothetical protein